MGSGGTYEVNHNSTPLSSASMAHAGEKPFMPFKDLSSITQSYKTQGPMKFQNTMIDKVQKQGQAAMK